MNGTETSAAPGGLRNLPGVRGVLYRLGLFSQRAGFVLRGAAGYARLRASAPARRPGVAAVMVGRNDDYMADFAERLHATVEWNTRYLVDEVVFVEWNPPPGRDLLAYGLARRFPSLRAYVVPPEIHEAICENARVPLLEYHAKNVGIRRARSPWVLATNADAALGFDIVNKVLNAKLDPGVAWTAERVDIPWREEEQTSIGILESLRFRRFIPYDKLGTGEFALASRELWHRTRGYDERMVRHRIGCDIRGTAQMLAHGARIERAGTVLHLQHPTSCTEGLRPHHGERAVADGVPYQNPETWGLGDRRDVQLADRVWRLE
ncbi:MAG TPA: hypothetical protein VGV38_12935 [Pyrinomonadaceae bacterium]|nr:hypothetical protein [Pyrinomonadaceae bacterium]